VVIGRLLAPPASAPPAAANADAPRLEAWGLLALAAIGGIGIAALVMWRTASAARRARELRAAGGGRSEAFLKEISGRSGEERT
jgi:hypothetical protein